MVHKKRVHLLLISLFLITFTVTTVAQATGRSITSTALDQKGAAVANAAVTLRNSAAGQTLVTKTTDAGSYIFPNVPVDDYVPTSERTGFATIEAPPSSSSEYA